MSEHRDLCSDEFGIFVDLLSVFSNACEGMELEQKRAAVRALVRQVIWDGETARVVLFGCEDEELDLPENIIPPERHQKGMMPTEVAEAVRMSRSGYIRLETGGDHHVRSGNAG